MTNEQTSRRQILRTAFVTLGAGAANMTLPSFVFPGQQDVDDYARFLRDCLGQKLVDDTRVVVLDQPQIPWANAELELFVVQAEEVKNRRQPVVVVDDAFYRVRRAVDIPLAEAAARDPLAEAVGIVVSSDVVATGKPTAELNHR